MRLGLDPPGTIAREVPRLRSVYERIEPCHMPNAVYIGSGHLGFRLSAGPLAPQCLPGPDGDAATCVVLYAQKLTEDQTLWQAVAAIAPWVENLVCDCPLGYPCHGEAIAMSVLAHRRGTPSSGSAKALEITRQPPRKRPRPERPHLKPAGRPLRAAVLAGAASHSAALEAHLSVPWSQVSVDRTFRKFFPADWLDGNYPVPVSRGPAQPTRAGRRRRVGFLCLQLLPIR